MTKGDGKKEGGSLALEEQPEGDNSDVSALDRQIARRLSSLRAKRGWTLDELADRTGISRASLSRLERCELSPTATMLFNLCGQYGWTLSRLMVEAEGGPPSVVRAKDQVTWKDPESGYVRRVVSPPHSSLRGELVKISLPAGSSIAYDTPTVPGLEHHLWMLEGLLSLEVDGIELQLRKGDCVRYVLSSPTRFTCKGKHSARYLVSLVHA